MGHFGEVGRLGWMEVDGGRGSDVKDEDVFRR